MEKQFSLEHNGQALEQDDVDLLGQTGGLADDRVFAELFRMTPFDGTNVAKAVIPSALPPGASVGGDDGSGSRLLANSTVQGNGPNTGQVRIKPMRVFVGSRTAVATDAKDNWRGIRSGLSVAEGATTTDTVFTIPDNPVGGTHRVDAVVARVDIDADSGTSKTVKMKSPTSGVVSAVSVFPYKATNVTIQLVVGTGTSLPSIPADVPGVTYYVVLAYLDITNNWGSGLLYTLQDLNIRFVAPVLSLHRAVGGRSLGPADCYAHMNVGLTAPFPVNSSGGWPEYVAPISGGDSIFFHTGDSYNPGSGDNVIDSRDWRNRICKWVMCSAEAGTVIPAWAQNTGSTNFEMVPMAATRWQTNVDHDIQCGMGQTFRPDEGSGYTGSSPFNGRAAVIWLDYATFHSSYTGFIIVYCDLFDGGKLKVHTSGTVPSGILAWIDFTAPFENVSLLHN